MIEVSKDAIKYKDSSGNMQSVGMLCNVSIQSDEGYNYLLKFFTGEMVDFYNEDLVETGNSAFISRYTLKSVSLPNLLKMNGATFSKSTALETIDLPKVVEYDTTEVYGCSALVTLNMPMLELTKASWSFYQCANLVNLKVKKIGINLSLSPCGLLSDESIQNIIDSLVDLTDKTAKTLTLHSDISAKLTDDQLQQITSKNWTLV